MKHNFEEKKQQRLENAYRLAAKNDQLSIDYSVRAHKIASFIPMGQPILIGHHSEKRHRSDLNKIDNNTRKSIEADKKADYYRSKIASIEANDNISSDDPEALQKLEQKLSDAKQQQQFMKEANKCIRKNDKTAFMKLPGTSNELWAELTRPGKLGGTGYAHFELTNNNAKIKSVEGRIKALKQVGHLVESETTIKGIKVRYNTTAGRLQLRFPGKPTETVRIALKRNGFNWSPTESAWQRLLNNNSIHAAKIFLRDYTPE